MKNMLSIDFEDWHQLVHRHVTDALGGVSETNLRRQMDTLLQVLADRGVHATFFALGMVAERCPDVVRTIAAGGHEIACHGYAHLIVKRITPPEFREDTRRAKYLLEDLTGQPVLGYRAAEFSIDSQSLWALEILAELGFEYDSSIFPIRHRRYGIPGFSPQPQRYRLASGASIAEVPISTIVLAGSRMPVAGGGYFRLLPFQALAWSVRRLNAEGLPMVTYFHPYEFDPRPLDIMPSLERGRFRIRLRASRWNFHQNLNRRTMLPKLLALLDRFQFTTCRSYLDEAELGAGRELLSAAR